MQSNGLLRKGENMNKIPFKTAYSEKNRIIAPAGNEIEPIYEYQIDNKGRKYLTQTGETNIYLEIQSHLESTKIENVLARVAVGDYSDFRPDGIYADVSEIPNNLVQAKQEMQKIENLWNTLSNEVKANYNFDVNQFMAEAGTEAWLIDAGLLNLKATEETTTSKDIKVETKVETPEIKEE